MPIKNPLQRFQPAPLYVVLVLSICYFFVQLILSHFSHALTLLMASYHMLCNIFALAGSIVTIKHNELHNENEKLISEERLKTATSINSIEGKSAVDVIDTKCLENGMTVNHPAEEAHLTEIKRRQMKTRNTFGWARIEILTMLIVCITLASLSFSLLVEALQTLVHIDHQDTMHYPVHVMILGFVGLLLNGFTYLLIGGYTLHQGNFLHINPKGNVVVEPSNISIETNTISKKESHNHQADLQLKEQMQEEMGKVHYRTRREGSSEFLRDVSSTMFVIICAIIIHYAVDKVHTAKFIDPILAIFSCVMVVTLSYPYMKESCLILLQTIPGSIDMENFERTLVTKFPQIISYHDLHIWQLSSHKFVATIHIIFQSPKLYEKTIEDVRSHFQEHSIMHVTIQPEFQIGNTNLEVGAAPSTECLMPCQNPDCMDKVCCMDSFSDLREVSVCGGEAAAKKSGKKHHDHGHGHSHAHGHGHDHHGHGKYKHKSHNLEKKHKCGHQTEEITEAIEEVPEIEQFRQEQEKSITENNAVIKEIVADINDPKERTVSQVTLEESDIKPAESLNSENAMPLESQMPKTEIKNDVTSSSECVKTSTSNNETTEETSETYQTKC